MTLLESLRVSLEALLNNKLRSVLTMLGIIIGVGSVIAIVAMGRGTEAAVRGELESIGSGVFVVVAGGVDPATGQPGRAEPFTATDLRNLETLLPDVEMVNTSVNMGATVKAGTRTMQAAAQGVPANNLEFNQDKLSDGRWFTEAEEASGARVAVLGQGAVKQLFGEGAAAVGRSLSINGYPFAVIGVREAPTGLLANMGGNLGTGDTAVFVPITFVRRVMGDPPVTMAQVKVKPEANPSEVMADAIALLERSHKGAMFTGQTFDSFLSAISSVMGIITGVLSAVAGISLLVGGVGIMNIMLVSVTERTREIGLRKAIGASYRDIMVQFLIEAVMLSLIGGAIGILLASVPVFFVGRWLKIDLLLDVTSVGLALGFSVGVGVLFGVYPASKAARLDPIEALRYE
ncbi:MAG: transporter permease protein [Symbiobacteriaceae bacterium]|jgi:putative ABC transport system permease protein|nr:transporter permease protein [Symbiobacteriaceae bacterium]